MQKKYYPTIVIAAFNRPHSLSRLLSSLSLTIATEDIILIISIDYNGENDDVYKIAEKFDWKFGKKEVIYHNKSLGLRNHIIKCGDLSLKYGSVIILEDDLVVSPYFYKYAKEAASFFENDEKIAGISLYNQPYTENVKLPFIPIKDNSDIYFMQIASSYGQLWTSNQWDSFKKWYSTNPDISKIEGLPLPIKLWPDTSWKKYYCAYLVLFKKYFVFPHLSYSTNFNDPGTNFLYRNHFGQTQIDLFNRQYKFKNLKDSTNVYDAYSELLPERLCKMVDYLKNYDFEVDLYGKKEKFIKEFVLTSKPCRDFIFGFEKSMKPQELNVIFNINGHDIFLAQSNDVIFYPESFEKLIFNRNMADFIKEYDYYYRNIFQINILMKILLHKIKVRIRLLFSKFKV